jgi:hypothetical protein
MSHPGQQDGSIPPTESNQRVGLTCNLKFWDTTIMPGDCGNHGLGVGQLIVSQGD